MHKKTTIDSKQAIWEAIRRLQSFTARQLQDQTRLNSSTVRDYIKGLEAAGYLAPYVRLYKEDAQWRLVKDIGVEAPRVRKDGTVITKGEGQRNMWEAMRILRTFTATELAIAATTATCRVSAVSAVRYARHLTRAGYLRRSADGAVYRFLPTAYTGPMAPVIQQHSRVWSSVWDPNTNELRYGGSVSREADDEQ